MRTEALHTLILGAGPSGLAAGYTLAKAGHRPVIVDRDTVPGGLMRSIHHGDFVVDVGRKELYNRLAKVDDFWESLLGADFRPYPHRGAFLYQGRLLEISSTYRGFRRGMSWWMFFSCVLGFLASRMNIFAGPPRTVEEYFYRTRGRLLTRIASQAFQEKLTGRKWSDMPLPENFSDGGSAGFITTLRAAFTRAFSKTEVNTYKNLWRHPARGTGQICDALAKGVTDAGGSFCFGAKILEVGSQNGKITSVIVETGTEKICYQPQHLISTIPLDFLIKLLGLPIPEAYTRAAGAPGQRKTVVLVYLFLNRMPDFPHAWLQVTDPSSRIGRITNYSNFNSDMVPPGKGCLCCEYYCFGADPLLELDPKALLELTLDFCVRSGLTTREAFVEERIMKLPGADASQNRHNWMTGLRLGLLDAVAPFKNLYCAGRTDLDIATLAGIESAEAVITGDRTTFDQHFDPFEIGIRSVGKTFEFRIPAGVDTSPKTS
jgi:protoporphyrinogen oxidase